jgi:hypothetical protein
MAWVASGATNGGETAETWFSSACEKASNPVAAVWRGGSDSVSAGSTSDTVAPR